MTPLEAFGVISGIASLAGLLYALYYGRASNRRKLLTYDVTDAVALATAFSPDDSHRLEISYLAPNGQRESLNSAFVRFVRIANVGREPIRGSDIAPANPLRLVVRGARVLDVALATVHRQVNAMVVTGLNAVPDGAESAVEFDFLDYGDGASLRVITADRGGHATLVGDIIGMPDGIRALEDVLGTPVLNRIGCALGIALQVTALVLAALVFRHATGEWSKLWLLALPFLALLLPAIVVALIGSFLWPSPTRRLEKHLALPEWFTRLSYARLGPPQGSGFYIGYGGRQPHASTHTDTQSGGAT